MAKAKVVCCPPKDQEALFDHPRVYFEVAENSTGNCPYCGKEYS